MSEPTDEAGANSENMSHEQARIFLGCSKSTLDRLSVRCPELKRYLPGCRRPIFRRADLRRLIDDGAIKSKTKKDKGGE
jgi:hypothetical protein